MSIVNEDAFCNSSFWDADLSWNTDNPDLSLCFEQTALAWTPCLLLWALSPLQVYFILTSKNRLVPWHFLNISRLVLNLVLVGVCAVNLCWSVVLYFAGEKVFPVEVWTPLIQTITFVLAAVMLLWNRIRGIHTCAVLFFFWLSLSISGLVQFRTEIRQSTSGIWQEHQYKFTAYMLYYPGVLIMLILNLFADPQPEETYYPKTKKLSPEIKASYPSRMVFGWFDQLIWKGLRKPLTVADLWDLRYQDTSAQVVSRFDESWKQCFETTKESTSVNGISNLHSKSKLNKPINIIYPILKTFWYPILAGAFSKVMGDILSFVNPQILNFMIQFVAGKEQMWKGFLYAIGMFVAAELQTIFFHQNLISMYSTGLNWKTSLMSAIYKKALRISNSARKTSTVGEVVNLMAVDAQRCADFAPFMHLMWTAPLVIIVAIYFLWHILGISSLAGLAVLVIIIPINTLIANKVKKMQMQQLKFKDERIKVMNEVLTGIKVLKLYAWEPSFKNEMLKIREKEISVLRRAALWNASTSFVWQCSSYLVSFVTFAVFVMIDERNVLNSEIAFVSSALFNVIRGPISFFPMMVQMFVQSVVSMRRINKFMNAEELDLTSVSHDETRDEPLIIERGSFSWGTEEADKAILRNITLRVKTGSLVAVVGAVGSGKSSLISAFLGEMDKISGYVNTKGQIAYVPQQAWIQNATVRDNIIFGNSFDNKRYFKAVEACALKEDFEMLPGGDSTEIGEKGINLSGGQKQRVSLARAVYHNADTYLMDDPLSAVDSHVGKHIFENVIGPKGQLRKKTRILVTHGIWFLPYVDTIIVMKNGEITEEGTYKELLAKKGEFSEFLTQHSKEDEEDSDNESVTEDMTHPLQRQKSKSGSIRSVSSTSTRKTSIKSTNTQPFTMDLDRLIQAEKTETGSVKMSVYMHYLRSVGLFLTLSTVGFQLISQALTMGANVTLSKWSSDPQAAHNGVQNIEKRNFYLEVFTAFGFGGMAAVVVSAYALAFGTTLASHYLHLSMLTNILRAPMSFFDTTPTGRIVNRFGKDVDVVDNTLPFSLSNAMSCFGNVIGTIVVITWSTPLFATAILPLGLLYYFVQKIYVITSRQLKRIESVSRSPIYSHFSETISGAPSIRAYKVEARFIKTLEDRVDANQVCQYPSLVSNRWLGIRLETVGNILIFFAATFAVLGRDSLNAGIVGLSISYALQITGMLSFAVRMSSEVETNIVSVERIKEYAEIPQEASWEVVPKPDPSWPNHGTVHFDNYQVRYREGLEMVLRGVSFVVNGGEKIGIVGRTGAGKSSLTLCLFRILEAAGGHIYIDGIDIANIGLGDLRSKLTIIPQDPVLFSGTLRSNLDPFEAYSDSQIWQSLELAHLKNFTSSLKAGLSHKVTEGGDNLSIGQRQLVCLARALLRKTQVLILDEATAAIDLETDDLIQQTIRREFRDCTVLTIAHRLNTIMDSDRVIVLEKGTIKEFDSPANLLQSPASTFYGLAADCGLVKRSVPLTEGR